MILIAFTIIGGYISANAQGQSPKERKLDAQEMTDRMAKDLELSKDQYTHVLAINQEMINAMEELGGREAYREKKMKIIKKRHAKLSEILSEEQMVMLKQNGHKRRENQFEHSQQRATE